MVHKEVCEHHWLAELPKVVLHVIVSVYFQVLQVNQGSSLLAAEVIAVEVKCILHLFDFSGTVSLLYCHHQFVGVVPGASFGCTSVRAKFLAFHLWKSTNVKQFIIGLIIGHFQLF